MKHYQQTSNSAFIRFALLWWRLFGRAYPMTVLWVHRGDLPNTTQHIVVRAPYPPQWGAIKYTAIKRAARSFDGRFWRRHNFFAASAWCAEANAKE